MTPPTLGPGVAAPSARRVGPVDAIRLTDEQRRLLETLAKRDREVRAHEQAHVEAGRPYAGPPVYAFERGPDGRRYAVSGAVAIDASPVKGDPRATAEKMRVVERAALAPAEPSPQDRRIAALARAEMARALAELALAMSPPRPGLLARV